MAAIAGLRIGRYEMFMIRLHYRECIAIVADQLATHIKTRHKLRSNFSSARLRRCANILAVQAKITLFDA